MRPVAGVGQRGGGGLSLHQSMAMGGLGQCLYSSVCADARHRSHHTDTAEMKFQNHLERFSLGKAKYKCQITDRLH